MDETLGVAAIDLSGRVHAVIDLKLKVRRVGDLAGGAGPRFLRGLRPGRARQRARQGAVRTIEPSPDRGAVQGVRPRAAIRLLARPPAGARSCRAPRGCCDRPDRLRRRQPDVGAQGIRRRGRGALRRRPVAGDLSPRAGDRRARRRPFRGHGRARGRVARRHSRRARQRGTLLFGICLGQQWLYRRQRRGPRRAWPRDHAGRCRRLPPTLKVPHVGWNALEQRRPSRLLEGIPDGAQVYFTHSYAADITAETVATTTHAAPFASVVETPQLFGVQFHPEKSGDAGIRMLRNFVALCSRND